MKLENGTILEVGETYVDFMGEDHQPIFLGKTKIMYLDCEGKERSAGIKYLNNLDLKKKKDIFVKIDVASARDFITIEELIKKGWRIRKITGYRGNATIELKRN